MVELTGGLDTNRSLLRWLDYLDKVCLKIRRKNLGNYSGLQVLGTELEHAYTLILVH